jgi:hypothetical protein
LCLVRTNNLRRRVPSANETIINRGCFLNVVDGRGTLEVGEEKQESKEDLINDKWVEDNFEDLMQEYPRRWIAVMDQKVIASGGLRYFLERKAKKMVKDKAYSIYFIPPTSTRTDVTYESH